MDVRCSYESLLKMSECPAREGQQIHLGQEQADMTIPLNKGFGEGATESVKYLLTFVVV